ncbi:MAG: MFS transporter, partial [Pseudomonadota bacterium]
FTLTLWSTFFGVAFTLLVALGLPLVDGYGVSALFIAHGLWMAGFAIVLTLFLSPLQEGVEGTLSLRRLLADHMAIYRSPWIAAPGAGWLFYTFCFLAILTVLPPYITPEWRAWVMGAMPLVSIAVSMTLGVWALRIMSAVQLTQAGFLFSVAALTWLLMAPGLPAACLVLAAGLGLVQGATFASIPQLNTSASTQAQAYGAMAQTGNLGNTVGTPALLAILGVAGYAGMIWTTMLVLVGGFFVHLWMAMRRRH